MTGKLPIHSAGTVSPIREAQDANLFGGCFSYQEVLLSNYDIPYLNIGRHIIILLCYSYAVQRDNHYFLAVK